ncbi:MAG: hypothetical protein A2Z32_03830 [Chloroflexi bacterium RBG_16_69_14]|nr:MAG: hypothetical protein A2Z32_03830 [Chloroflexi bacterium RBG_16_69_14]
MSALVLTTASKITCPHQGTAILKTSNTSAKVGGAYALLVSDVHNVVGCPFMIGQKYSPCKTIEWSQGAQDVKVGGTAVLFMNSIGKCLSPENSTQGVAIKQPIQTVGKAQ